ncbi:MAG: amino acid ABC transporter substrate-binding protein [Clostridia bacterium]|nr:amino acid ABC transporter substrate-binding protein [Clostridia bacterium]
MKKLTMVLALVMALLLCALPAWAEETDASIQYILDKGELILGLDDTFPPMGFRDDNNEIVGYDIDLAKEVASRLGVTLKTQPIEWDAKELELSSKSIDCIWNGLSITPARQESMSMTKGYMNNKIVLVVKGDKGYAAKEDLVGKKIAVQNGSFAQEVLEEYEEYKDFYASVDVLGYDEYLTALMDLQQDGVDAVLIDLVVAEYRIAGLNDDNLVLIDSLEDDIFGVGFRKEDAALRDKVNAILAEMAQDGATAKISEKWFGKDISILEDVAAAE